jgi:bifunctional non-homologous end joining protein LigD
MPKLDSLPKRFASFLEPMDCERVSKLPIGGEWVFEIKLDGYRAIAVKSKSAVSLLSRRHKSFNGPYPPSWNP